MLEKNDYGKLKEILVKAEENTSNMKLEFSGGGSTVYTKVDNFYVPGKTELIPSRIVCKLANGQRVIFYFDFQNSLFTINTDSNSDEQLESE